MKREIVTTGDGSKSINIPEWNEQYHSKHGALNEALHVFIEMGLKDTLSRKQDSTTPVSILEYGLGAGLNAMVTAVFDTKHKIHYTGLEAYPVSLEQALEVNYGELLDATDIYKDLHEAPWNESVALTDTFTIHKQQRKFQEVDEVEQYDLMYYDAFGPRVQPDLWKLDIFKAAFRALKPGGILTTYCAQGQARRNMVEAGFRVERLPGPPAKREMLRARKV